MRRLIVYILVIVILVALVRGFLAERSKTGSQGTSSSSARSLPSSKASRVTSRAASRSSASCMRVSLVFYSKTDFEKAEFLHPVTVTRCIQQSTQTVYVVLKQLFMGPTAEEKKKGALGSADLGVLGTFFLGATVENGVVTVNFKKDALSILSSAAARQMMAKAPIEATMKDLAGVREVRYAIEGKVWTEWGA